MNILLDTHMIIWALTGSEKLPEKARKMILDTNNDIYFSVLSLWEIEIKRLKQNFPLTAHQIAEYCNESGFKQLILNDRHIDYLQELRRSEKAPNHKDPFNRMLISQAAIENMTFLTHDSLLSDYNCKNVLTV